jgi:phage protein D
MTDNEGFWIGSLDLLATPSFTITRNHNQLQELQPKSSSFTLKDSSHFRSRSTTATVPRFTTGVLEVDP